MELAVGYRAGLMMVGFGGVMLVPAPGGQFAGAASGLAVRADAALFATSGAGLSLADQTRRLARRAAPIVPSSR